MATPTYTGPIIIAGRISYQRYKTVEELFDWTELEVMHPHTNVYHNCTIKVRISKFPPGSQIFMVSFDTSVPVFLLFETERDFDRQTPVEVCIYKKPN